MKHEINVPKGYKVVSVETTDEMVVVKFEKEEPEFKENDIIYTEFHFVYQPFSFSQHLIVYHSLKSQTR